jgi:hypothetical protein
MMPAMQQDSHAWHPVDVADANRIVFLSPRPFYLPPAVGALLGWSLEEVGTAIRDGEFESAINRHVGEGWDFCQVAQVSVEVQPGCLAGLFGQEVQHAQLDQIIFRRSGMAQTFGVRRDVVEPVGEMPRPEPYVAANGGEIPALSFCYHCGAETAGWSSICSSCGKSL